MNKRSPPSLFLVLLMLLLAAGIGVTATHASISAQTNKPPAATDSGQAKGQPQTHSTNANSKAAPLDQPAAAQSVLYDQYDNQGDASANITSQDFESTYDIYDAQAADDFVVPAGPSWRISEVDVDGDYGNGPGPAASFNVYFYQNSGVLPGTPVYSATNQTYTGTAGDAAITLSVGAVLSPGTYWVSVQARQDFGTAGQWYWHNRTVQAGSEAGWRNPSNGFATGCIDWNAKKTSCLTSQDGPDEVFRLVGTIGCGPYILYGNGTNNGACSTIFSTNGGSPNGGWQFTQNLTGAVGVRSTNASGIALYGLSTSSTGVQGVSTSSYGVRASSSSSYGLLGTSTSSVGVRGTSQTYYGFYAGSTSGVGGYAYTASGSAAFRAHNDNTSAGHYGIISDGDVLVNGDLSCTGNCNAAMGVKTDAGEKMVYAEAGTQNFISDQGTATLKGGHAVIKIDPTFAKTVNLNKPYMVIVVPNSADTAGLAVINKKGDSFEVVELGKGKGTFTFDYRITGLRQGMEATRLANAPAAVQMPPAPKDDPKP